MPHTLYYTVLQVFSELYQKAKLTKDNHCYALLMCIILLSSYKKYDGNYENDGNCGNYGNDGIDGNIGIDGNDGKDGEDDADDADG